MRGVKFGEYHSGDDWEIILSAKTLTPPEPQATRIEIPGRDGSLDISEALTGEIRYNDRIATLGFTLVEGSYEEREILLSEIFNIIHGRKLNIILPDFPDRYLVGRCNITDRDNDKSYGVFTVEATCEPWFYAVEESVRTFDVSGAIEVSLSNLGVKTLIPEIKVTGSIVLKIDGTSISLTSGTYRLPGLKLKTGHTSLTLEGSGSITFNYREGWL